MKNSKYNDRIVITKYVKLRIRAFGQMGLRVLDVTTLFKEVIGGMQKADIVKFDKIKEYYRGILVIKAKSAIADAIINNGISALEISTKLESLSEKVKEQISPEFEKYGFTVANFYIQSINFPNEDFEKINKILEDKAAFGIIGFLALAYFIFCNMFSNPVKVGYFVPLVMTTVIYTIVLDVINIACITSVSSVFFTLIHLVILFVYCLVSIPMYLMGRR